MGTIIGRQGLKIKHIQDVSGVRMVAQKEMLPQSTERVVEVQGTPEGIQRAIWEISKCLVDDWQRGTGTVLYNPVVRTQSSRLWKYERHRLWKWRWPGRLRKPSRDAHRKWS